MQLVDRTVYISVPECGIDGHAKVLAVEDCPNLKPRPGPKYQLVTATFKHHGAKVVDVHVAGLTAPIGSTPNHPFWSEDKQRFVRADELKPGEHLRQTDGSLTTVTALIPRAGTHNVYNLEVHRDHVYHVANNGVLVHNGSADDCLKTLYRVIRDDEDIMIGLTAKNPGFAYPRGPATHVLHGSKDWFKGDTWISTTRSLDKAREIQSLYGGRIVEIDLTRAGHSIWGKIDFNNPTIRSKYLTGPSANRYAAKWEEVLIEGWVPPWAITPHF